jgi:predicted DNA-binding protein (UPF0251 family)
VFKPAGVPDGLLEQVRLSLDEFEAVRLADHEGLYQEAAAEVMGVSRQTFGRILESAHRAIARALVFGSSLHIEGGSVTMRNKREFVCSACNHTWLEPFGTGRPAACPACKATTFHRVGTGCGRGEGRRRRHNQAGFAGRGHQGGNGND